MLQLDRYSRKKGGKEKQFFINIKKVTKGEKVK